MGPICHIREEELKWDRALARDGPRRETRRVGSHPAEQRRSVLSGPPLVRLDRQSDGAELAGLW